MAEVQFHERTTVMVPSRKVLAEDKIFRHINVIQRLKPLPFESNFARCYSRGGQVSVANPAYTRQVTMARITASDLPYVAYCSNCRDIFTAAGKPCRHILDIVLGLNDMHRKGAAAAGLTQPMILSRPRTSPL